MMMRNIKLGIQRKAEKPSCLKNSKIKFRELNASGNFAKLRQSFLMNNESFKEKLQSQW